MPATGTSMTQTMMAARTVATTVSARVRMRTAAAALSCGMLESVLLMSLQIEPRWQPILSDRVIVVEAGDVGQFAMPE
jgi:hypothetical protein